MAFDLHILTKVVRITTKEHCYAKEQTESEAQFKKLTPNQKRVLIAKDVLAQLALRRYVAKAGTYIKIKNAAHEDDRHEHPSFIGREAKADDPLHELLNKSNAPSCHVCAVGAACCSAVRLFDQATYNHDAYDYDGTKKLDMWTTVKKYFPVGEDREGDMEAWFERNTDMDEWNEIDDEELRLTAIYENIVANKGVFKTPDKWWRKFIPKKYWEQAAKKEEAEAALEKLEKEYQAKREALEEEAYA